MKVTLNGQVLADSNNTIIVENNHYFPPDSVSKSLFKDSKTTSVCPWKGDASYYDADLPDGTVVSDVAWYYPNAKPAASNIKGYVAFYKNKVTFE